MKKADLNFSFDKYIWCGIEIYLGPSQKFGEKPVLRTLLFTKVVLNSILVSLFFFVLTYPFYALEFLFQVKEIQLSLFPHLSCCRKPFRFAKIFQSSIS